MDFDLLMYKDCVQVRIMLFCLRNFYLMVIMVEKDRFLFSYFLDEIGIYIIEIIINGRYI